MTAKKISPAPKKEENTATKILQGIYDRLNVIMENQNRILEAIYPKPEVAKEEPEEVEEEKPKPTKEDYIYHEVDGYIMDDTAKAWKVHVVGGSPKGFWVPKKSMKQEFTEPNQMQKLQIQGWKIKEMKLEEKK